MTKENNKPANPIKTAGLEELNKIRDEVTKERDELLELQSKLESRKQEIDVLEKAQLQRQNELNRREQELMKKEAEAAADFPQRMEQELKTQRSKLQSLMDEITDTRAELEKKQIELDKRSNAVKTSETQIRQRLSELDTELQKYRLDKTAEINDAVEKERTQRLDQINRLMDQEAEKRTKQNEADQQRKKNELNKRENDLNAKEDDLTRREVKLKADNELLKSREDNLERDREQIEHRVEELVEARKKSFAESEKGLNEELERLRSINRSKDAELQSLIDVRNLLNGKDANTVLSELESGYQKIRKEREDFNRRTEADISKETESLKIQISTLQKQLQTEKERVEQLSHSHGNYELENKIKELQYKCDLLNRNAKTVNDYTRSLEYKIERLTAAYGNVKDREARIKDISIPYFDKYDNLPSIPKKGDLEKIKGMELQWLDVIINSSKGYGIHFPTRIVYAFHTCLKCAEWSPLTVLAGVSGTGKSELPRFYSLFGGMPFLPVAVQPNWDSQESMLGYFNSIDNKFDAQPILRVLTQATMERSEAYPSGLKNAMNLILLDEMNLAHVELYFADFLSKLETRRGMKTNLPEVDVKLGAGIKPYELELTRNVLWVGTMNQDETTKSLSDKVLDRGNVIFFPRPKDLKSRKDLKPLPPLNFLLDPEGWKLWCRNELAVPEDIMAPYKHCIEKINDRLAYAGRALGHRVWQTIEYYMNNYPTVIPLAEAKTEDQKRKLDRELHKAFEDALVQKVMPKLRGIETEGSSREKCLDPIAGCLAEGVNRVPFALSSDYQQACNNPFGQFIWNSAEYILKDEEERKKKAESAAAAARSAQDAGKQKK